MIGNLNIANSNRKDTNIKFTKDQEIAVHELIEFLAQPWDDKKYINALCGAGGTGKTFVIKYVINNCKWSGGVIGCAAPTHKACRVLSNSIGGKEVNTIQSCLVLDLMLILKILTLKILPLILLEKIN